MLNGRNATDSFLLSGHDHPLRLRIAPAMERCGRKLSTSRSLRASFGRSDLRPLANKYASERARDLASRR